MIHLLYLLAGSPLGLMLAWLILAWRDDASIL